MTAKTYSINVDDPEELTSSYPLAVLVVEITRTLDRLYGRQVAQRYFTKHIKFDTIKITVK